jgi:ferritin
MRVQAQEEIAHGVKLNDYVVGRDGKVTFGPIEAPPSSWTSPLAVFEFGYCHEVTVTRAIHALVDRAVAVKDHATATFLQWYVTEQVEEEATFKELVDQLKLAGDQGAALLMIDRELSSRTFTPAADQSAT